MNLPLLAPALLLLAVPPQPTAGATRDAQVARAPSARVVSAKEDDKERDLTHYNLGKDNLAVQGYDPVAYFEEGGGKAKQGSKEITLVYRGVLYRFASEEHRKLFEKQPTRYEPAYGGWCAYAMAKEDKVEIDPESFLVTDGELMLFYKSWLNDTRKKWLKEPDVLKPKADAYWKSLTEKK